MRLLVLAIPAAAWAAAWVAAKRNEPFVLVVGGDTRGYLSPCGCTKPMSGGVKRRATAIRSILAGRSGCAIENGGLAAGSGAQDRLKAEALTEVLGSVGVAALNFGPSEAKFGPGFALLAQQMLGGAVVTGSMARSQALSIEPFVVRGPLVIGGASANPEAVANPLGEKATPLSESVRELAEHARTNDLAAVLMLQGDLEAAKRLAHEFPSLSLIVYSSSGAPPAKPQRSGRVFLVSPGDKGMHLVRLSYDGGTWGSYASIKLGPETKDDSAASTIYKSYLARLGEERLLESAPRVERGAFAGSKRCAQCHAKAKKAWEDSGHYRALKTLEREGHDLDPDCVGCHVVGLDATQGFRSRTLTADLADVGCESCHGPGERHASKPSQFRMTRVGRRSCEPCHNAEHSPGFDFVRYWEKIAH
jgi:hypothetical protein